MKITISKSQWESLNVNTLNKYSSTKINNKLYIKISAAQWQNIKLAGYISHQEFVDRMSKIGWDMSPAYMGDYTVNSPDGAFKLTISGSPENWEKNWRKPKQHIMQERAKHNLKPYDLLDFVFDPEFHIPENFDPKKQLLGRKEIYYQEKKIPNFNQLPAQLLESKDIVIKINDKWKEIENVDYSTNSVMDSEGNIYTISADKYNPITIGKKETRIVFD